MKKPAKRSAKPSGPIRIGVIGLGQIALKAHLPGYAKTAGCQITAVHSLREGHAKQVAVQYGIPHIYTDLNRLLESDQVDAVSICTPNFTHAPITLKAFREGKHVMVEKPMAVTHQEGLDMIRAAAKAKKVLMVHHNMRFDPAVRTAEKLLRKKAIGDIFAFKGSLTHKGPEAWSPKANWFFDRHKSGGGAMMDLGPHVFGSLEFLLGETLMMAGAVAAMPKGASSSPEIHCDCLLRSKSGAIGTVNLGWADTAYHNRFYFFGSKGSLSLNLAKGDPITIQYRNQDGNVYPPLDKDCFSPSIYEHFIDCIRAGKTPWVSGQEGLRTVELIESGYHLIRRPAVPVI
jgi:predicted dehydrogenase